MAVQTLSMKEYIKNIKDLELSCCQQEKLLRELRARLVAVEGQTFAPEQGLWPAASSVKRAVVVDAIGSAFVALIGAAVGALAGIGVRIAVSFSAEPSSSPWMAYILWGAGVGFALGFLLTFLLSRAESRRKNEADAAVLQRWIEEGEETYQHTKDLLKKYYEVGCIPPVYRGIVPVSTILGYLEEGRCVSLLGREGACHLYAQERTARGILEKLDDTVNQLEISQRTLARYFSEAAASNTALMSWLTAFEDSNKRKQ